MPRFKSETIGTGDMSWLGSAHNIRGARTEQVNVSAFTAATHYPNGYIPSGTPVAKVAGLLVPYDSAEATVAGAGVLAGHILTDQTVTGTSNFAVPLLDHGRVKAAKVPQGVQAFTAPVAAAKRAATTINYV